MSAPLQERAAADALDKAAELAAASEAVVQEWRERGDGGCSADVRARMFLAVSAAEDEGASHA